MFRKLATTIASLFIMSLCSAQKQTDSLGFDDLSNYEDLFSELDALIDSLTSPRSFTIVNLTIGQSFLSYQNKIQTTDIKRQVIYAPTIGYYDKIGVGASVGASIVNDGSGLNPYQFSITGSYDYLKSKAFITGISLTHYFTKGDLPFYTSPLENEAYGYFTYRRLWFKPSFSFSYGWGSRDDFEETEERIREINLARYGFTRINTTEKVVDINLATSVRHDFYFLNALGSDYLRFTPQLSFVSGTQQFGLNQTSNSYITLQRTGKNVLYNSENISFDDELALQPLSLTAFLKNEWSKGKFYFQPQLILDYYFPSSSHQFSTGFVINAGFLF